jgi:SPP1 family predicted phage head-tail adaptor
MRIGLLDRRVTIQSLSTVLDGAGQEVETWGAVATVWMRVRPFRGGERFTAQQVVGKAVTTFEARYRSDVTIKNRLLWDGKTWDIADIRQLGRKERMEMDATARAEG